MTSAPPRLHFAILRAAQGRGPDATLARFPTVPRRRLAAAIGAIVAAGLVGEDGVTDAGREALARHTASQLVRPCRCHRASHPPAICGHRFGGAAVAHAIALGVYALARMAAWGGA